MTRFQVLVNTFPLLQTCTALPLCLLIILRSRVLSTKVIFDEFLVFYFPFSQVQTIIFSSFFPSEIGDKFTSIFDVVTREACFFDCTKFAFFDQMTLFSFYIYFVFSN